MQKLFTHLGVPQFFFSFLSIQNNIHIKNLFQKFGAYSSAMLEVFIQKTNKPVFICSCESLIEF